MGNKELIISEQNKFEGKTINEMALEYVLKELDELNESNKVKNEIKKYLKNIKETNVNNKNLILLGTSKEKRKLVRIITNGLCALGLTSTNNLVEVGRDDLVGDVIGATEVKTKAVIDKAMGGVLFIDEAYTLAEVGNDFGKHAVEKIMTAMEDNRDNFVVIVAGYEDKMGELFKLNEGIESRFRSKIHLDN